MTANVVANSAKKIAVGGVQAIHAMFSIAYFLRRNATERNPLSHGERVGVRGYGLSMGRPPSPGFVVSRQIRPLPMGEVKQNPVISCNRTFIGLHPSEREAARDVIADEPDHQR